jgi:multiple sugar transport system permease protein
MMNHTTAAPLEARGARHNSLNIARRRRKIVNFLLIALAILLAVLIAFPIYWFIRCSLVSKTELMNPEFFAAPARLFPTQLHLDNFSKAILQINFLQQLWNSVMITALYVLGNLLTTSVSAYAFARIRFPLKRIWFALVICTMMLPSAVTLLPQYAMYTKIGLVGPNAVFGGRLPLVLPAFFCASGNAYFVFLLYQFFRTIPIELDEAARIDGAGFGQIFRQIMLPLVRPALIVVALFSFVNCWNEFFYSIIYLQSEKSYTLTLGLYIINGVRLPNYEQVMALAVMVTAPCLVFFLIGNKYFVEGIKMTGIKG